ncbi:hypothetical protein CC78DRAFT_534519 [Lojkania enalia]|uniref:F-box domain-containing protein n=1 Tax=Lojkania enalia TaxID=147567 RepID=A0A9P4K608_9PLEO|nr:hypothetical protein CC78DRAFT_534519 [Didymosphaeria enalia]
MAAPTLPVDVWLLVFAQLDDINLLWSTVRNVSRFLRACVDEFFSHGVIQQTFVDLHYSDFHFRSGPVNNYIHVPMVFAGLLEGGARAVFQQRAYCQFDSSMRQGSVRGWVPFIERCHKELQLPAPRVLNKSKASEAPPLWELEHSRWRNALAGDAKRAYLLTMGNMTSIGRGDRPPYYLKIADHVNDSELVDLVVDCERHEISFDWRRTFSMFFLEVEFAARASQSSGTKTVYDKDLIATLKRYPYENDWYDDRVRARSKRLAAWTAKNKHRSSPDFRLWTLNRVGLEKDRVRRFLTHKNLQPVPEEQEVVMAQELVPERLADDHPNLLFWPWGDDDVFFVPTSMKRAKLCNANCCVVL